MDRVTTRQYKKSMEREVTFDSRQFLNQTIQNGKHDSSEAGKESIKESFARPTGKQGTT